MADRTPLVPGRKFRATYRKQEYLAVVDPDGTISVIDVGSGYKTLSKAGVAVTGYPTNGWRFWQDDLRDEDDDTPGAKPKKGKKGRVKKSQALDSGPPKGKAKKGKAKESPAPKGGTKKGAKTKKAKAPKDEPTDEPAAE